MNEVKGRFYFRPKAEQDDPHFFIQSLGIHEKMPKKMITHGGDRWPVLIIIFHSPAYVKLPYHASNEIQVHGHTVVWGTGAHHHYGNIFQEWDHSWINIGGDWIDHWLDIYKVPCEKPLPLLAENIGLRYLEQIYHELTSYSSPHPKILSHLTEIWIMELSRLSQISPKKIPEAVLYGKYFIESQFRTPITLQEIASYTGLSVSHFSSLFRRHLHLSPIQYLIQLRLERAKELLMNPLARIKDVALLTGFSDQRYFCRLFRRYFGITPKQYRQQFIKESQ